MKNLKFYNGINKIKVVGGISLLTLAATVITLTSCENIRGKEITNPQTTSVVTYDTFETTTEKPVTTLDSSIVTSSITEVPIETTAKTTKSTTTSTQTEAPIVATTVPTQTEAPIVITTVPTTESTTTSKTTQTSKTTIQTTVKTTPLETEKTYVSEDLSFDWEGAQFTKENINDSSYFYNAIINLALCNEVYNGYWVYYDYYNDVYAKKNITGLNERLLFFSLLNLDYLEPETLVACFGGHTNEQITKLIDNMLVVIGEDIDHDNNTTEYWDQFIIDKSKVKIFKDVVKAYNAGNTSKLKETIAKYYDTDNSLIKCWLSFIECSYRRKIDETAKLDFYYSLDDTIDNLFVDYPILEKLNQKSYQKS